MKRSNKDSLSDLTEKELKKSFISNVSKLNPSWSHDIKYIQHEGKEIFIEDAVCIFQKMPVGTQEREDIIAKIIHNYSIFKYVWANQFAPFSDTDIVEGKLLGELIHDEVIYKVANEFDITKAKKEKGKAFNAYLVSSLCNTLRNVIASATTGKHLPQVKCEECGEMINRVDDKHLKHEISLDRYKKMFPHYPVVSHDGKITCPHTGKKIKKITESYLNKLNKTYTLSDFFHDFPNLKQRNLVCPVTNMEISNIDDNYPNNLISGYSESEFIKDFPEWDGIFSCPFTSSKMIKMTQEHLDHVLGQRKEKERFTFKYFEDQYPNATYEARQVKVLNPYTGKMVDEITMTMLKEAGVSLQEHLAKYSKVKLDHQYIETTRCPFTGDKYKTIKREYLAENCYSEMEFYLATCEYPIKKWQIKCAICGEWCDNIWSHLEEVKHTYAESMNVDTYKIKHPKSPLHSVITSGTYVEGDDGELVHIADLKKTTAFMNDDKIEVVDSLMAVAENAFEEKLAKYWGESQTLEDICYLAAEMKKVNLKTPHNAAKPLDTRNSIKNLIGHSDFSFEIENHETANVFVPSKETIKNKLLGMFAKSDLNIDVDVEDCLNNDNY